MFYLYRSRKPIGNSRHGSRKEGEHNALLLSDDGQRHPNNRLEKEGELDAPMYSNEYYLMMATKYAHEGNQPKF